MTELFGVVRINRGAGHRLTAHALDNLYLEKRQAQAWRDVLMQHRSNGSILTYEVWPAEDVDRLRVQQALTGAE